MPLNKKGRKIMGRMRATYGPKKGEEVFYAAKNKGKIDDVEDYRAGSLGDYCEHGSYQTGSVPQVQQGSPQMSTSQQSTGGGQPKIDTSQGLYGGLWKAATGEQRNQLAQATEADRQKGGEGLSNQERRDFLKNLGVSPSGGTSTQVPTGSGDPSTPEGQMGKLSGFGQGLMDPQSDMSKRWMEQMREQIGGQTDAAQRASAYQAAQQGFGAGASPEQLQMQSDLGVQGLESAGQAASDFMLKAPTLGVQAAGTALGAGVGMRGQDLQSKMASEQNRLQREQQNASLQMQQRQLDVQRELGLQESAYGKELAALYGGGGGGGGYQAQPSYGGYGGGVGGGTSIGYR